MKLLFLLDFRSLCFTDAVFARSFDEACIVLCFFLSVSRDQLHWHIQQHGWCVLHSCMCACKKQNSHIGDACLCVTVMWLYL